jgi:hypothetical protein
VKVARAVAVALAVAALAVLVYAFARRAAYPYDLEWMEGGMLCHALRLAEGKPIYAAPSVDFVPFLYTPLYPAILALLSKVVGLGYGLARAVSLLSFFAALVLGYVFARREGGSRACALAAMAIPAAAFVPTGAFYDLARPDSLFLGLTTAALTIGWWKRSSHAGAAAAAALLVAAFFTKQTASPFMIALGVAYLVASRRVVPVYLGTLALLGLPALWLSNHFTDGWFWTYIFRMHQQHGFDRVLAFWSAPLRLFLLIGPAALLVPWALARRPSPSLWYAAWIAAAGAGVACVGYGTQWAYLNAFIPGVFFPSLAAGVAAGRLIGAGSTSGLTLATPRDATPRLRPHVVYVALAATLAIAPGTLVPLVGRFAPRRWKLHVETPTGYDVRPYLPRPEDRARGYELVARIAATPGDVLIPFHPFYARLAGKRTYLHRMGVLDVNGAGLGSPRGLAEALAEHRFAAVVMDDKFDNDRYRPELWPGLLTRYQIADRFTGPKVVTGAPTEPRYWLQPTTPPVIDKDREP